MPRFDWSRQRRAGRTLSLCHLRARALFVAIATLGCTPRQPERAIPRPATLAAHHRVSYIDSVATGVNAVPAQSMRAAMRAQYRLRPDRRFLLAIADVHRTLTGDSLAVVEAHQQGEQWLITYANAEVGPLPNAPTYNDARALLDRWVQQVAAKHAVARDRSVDSTLAVARRLVADYRPEKLFEVVRLIDIDWATPASRHPALFAPAAQALTGLLLQSVDIAETGDVLAGRALAYVSLAGAVAGDPLEDTDALLAWLLGYTHEAAVIAEHLPADHPVRRLIARDFVGLAGAAADSSTGRLTRFAYLRTLAVLGRREDWLRATSEPDADIEHDPEVAATGLLLNDFAMNDGLPLTVERAMLERIAPEAGRTAMSGPVRVRFASFAAVAQQVSEPPTLSPAATLPRLGARVRAIAPTLTGPALDTTVYAVFHRATLHSAYLAHGLFHIEQRADYPAAVHFGQTFEGLDSTTADGELGAWYARLANAYATGVDRMTLLEDLGRFPSLSGNVLRRTFEAVGERSRVADPRRLRMVRLLADRLDTRPSQRKHYARAARDELLDPVLVAQLYGAGSETLLEEDPELAIWLASAYRDTVALRRIVSNARASAWARGAALGDLAATVAMAPDDQRRGYERLIAEYPTDWSLRDAQIRLLRDLKDFAAAEREARDYIRRGLANNGFDLIAANVSIAQTLMLQSRHREAWTVVRSVVPTYQAAALRIGVLALARGGRLADAETLATRLVERYPTGAAGRAARLEVWWRLGRHASVATELRENEWLEREPWVARAFIDVFGAADERTTGLALVELVQGGVPGAMLHHIALRVHAAGRDDLAFALASRATDPNPLASAYQAIEAHRYLAAARGREAAAEWLRERLPMPLTDEMAFFLAEAGDEDLLWSWSADDTRDEGRWTWLARATMAARAGLDTHPRRQELLDHYATQSDNAYHLMGRHMVGLEREDALLAVANSLHRKCEVAFYLGARARAEGRIADAVDWFRVAVETAQMRDGEYYWAIRALAELTDDPRGLNVPSALPGMPLTP